MGHEFMFLLRKMKSTVPIRIVGFHLSEGKMAFILGFLLFSSLDSAKPDVIPELELSSGCPV